MRNILILLSTTLVLSSCSALDTADSQEKPEPMYLLDYPVVGVLDHSLSGEYVSSPETETETETENETAKETVKETVNKTENQTVKEAVNEPTKETAKEAVNKPANEIANKPVTEPAKESVKETVKEPLKEPVKITVKEPVKKTVNKAKRARIVAIEPPPLRLQEGWNLQHIPPDSIGAAHGLAEIAGILVLAEAPAIPQPAAQASDSPHGSAKNLWIPTAVLADEAVRQLQVAGWEVEPAEGLRSPPGMKIGEYDIRGRDLKDFYYDNWLTPIRLWYKADQSSFDYGRETTQGKELSIEIALRSFEAWPETRLSDAQLRISVFIKVVDPGTSRTLGRATCGGILESSIGSDDQAFANDGKIFKEVFARRGQELVRDCLTSLKLLPHA